MVSNLVHVMQQDNDFPCTLEQFRAWLESYPEESVIGRAEHSNECPIAQFIEKKTGRKISISRLIYMWVDEDRPLHINTPVWAGVFIRRIDAMHTIAVTARAALEVIDLVQTELAQNSW